MILLNGIRALVRPIESRMMSALFFAAQIVLMACLMVLGASWLQSVVFPQMIQHDIAPVPASFYYDKCNLTFVHTPFSRHFPSPGLLVPQGELEWKDHACLLSSALSVLFYHISCILVTSGIMLVLMTFLVMGMFVLDLLHEFWRGVTDELANK